MEIFTIKKKKRKGKKDQEERQRQWNKRDSVGLGLCSLTVRPPQSSSTAQESSHGRRRRGQVGSGSPNLGPQACSPGVGVCGGARDPGVSLKPLAGGQVGGLVGGLKGRKSSVRKPVGVPTCFSASLAEGEIPGQCS